MSTSVTGRISHRVVSRWFRKPILVVQVEMKRLIPEGDSCTVETWWQDATPELMESALAMLME